MPFPLLQEPVICSLFLASVLQEPEALFLSVLQEPDDFMSVDEQEPCSCFACLLSMAFFLSKMFFHGESKWPPKAAYRGRKRLVQMAARA